MKIAELFIQLGIAGTNTVSTALQGVRQTFSGITSTSLETKAAILGVLYGLERLTSNAAEAGTALTQFGNLTGLSQNRLQRWQYLLRQSGVDVNQATTDVQNLQAAMAKLYLGQGAPAGLNAVGNTLKGSFDPRRYRDTFYMLEKLREYLRTTKDIPDIANNVVQSFGLSPATIQALRTSTVDLEKVNRDRLYSMNETKRLNDVTVGFSNLYDKFQKNFGKQVSVFGPGMLKDLNQVADAVLRLSHAFGELNKNTHAIELVGKIFEGWAGILDLLTSTVKDVNKNGLSSVLPDRTTLATLGVMTGLTPVPAVGGTKNVTNNVTVHAPITGMKDSQDAAKHLSREINNAFRPYQQGGGY